MRGRPSALTAALALCLLSCRREVEPLGPHAVFVPVTLRSSLSGRIPWRTRAELSNAGAAAATVRLHRWPPDRIAHEVEDVLLAPGGRREVAMPLPEFPAVSSLLASGATPFGLKVSIFPADASRPPLDVPVVPVSDLARPGDRLRVGPLVSSDAERSHFAFTFPWTEHDAVPFRVRVELSGVDGRELGRHEHAIRGLPQVVEDPWADYGIRERVPLQVAVTFLGSARGRKPRLGLWVYGIVQDRRTGESRFLRTTVERSTVERSTLQRR